jgi:hypothetical protein
MASVISTIRIEGPIEPIFDLVTTTRFWPQWHPATLDVGGVTERPILLNDVVRERARIGEHTYEGNWTVIEHQRPSRVVLRGESGRIQITYLFQARGEATEFRRVLEYQPEDFAGSAPDPQAVEKLMIRQSEEAAQKLKRLVEGILREE